MSRYTIRRRQAQSLPPADTMQRPEAAHPGDMPIRPQESATPHQVAHQVEHQVARQVRKRRGGREPRPRPGRSTGSSARQGEGNSLLPANSRIEEGERRDQRPARE